MLKDLIGQLAAWYAQALDQGGYWVVAGMMALESTVFPLPSEIVIPPAAYLASTTGRLSVTGVVVAGAVGSWVGASIMYFAARAVGRPLLMRYGRYALLPPAKIEAAERFARRYGVLGVFVARFLPVIRHLVGIPAGLVRLDFLRYSVMTLAGSALWCAVLAFVGVSAGRDTELMNGSLHRLMLWVFAGLAVLCVLYYAFVHRATRDSGR